MNVFYVLIGLDGECEVVVCDFYEVVYFIVLVFEELLIVVCILVLLVGYGYVYEKLKCKVGDYVIVVVVVVFIMNGGIVVLCLVVLINVVDMLFYVVEVSDILIGFMFDVDIVKWVVVVVEVIIELVLDGCGLVEYCIWMVGVMMEWVFVCVVSCVNG